MNPIQIAEFLERLGWSYKPLTDSVLRADYKGVFGNNKVFFYIHDGDLRIAINPVLEKPEGTDEWSESVNQLVAALNQESPTVRMGIDRSGDLFAKVELPKQNLNFEQFTYALLNLCQVAEQLTVPVLQAQAYEHLDKLVSQTL